LISADRVIFALPLRLRAFLPFPVKFPLIHV